MSGNLYYHGTEPRELFGEREAGERVVRDFNLVDGLADDQSRQS